MMVGPSGDRILAAAVIALVAFLLGLAVGPSDVLDGIRHFPAPTAAWATIVGALVWPAVIVWALLRFAAQAERIVETFASRFAGDRKVRIGGVELERDGDRRVDPADSQDLLDLINDPAKLARLDQWLATSGLKPVPRASVFCVGALYADYHKAALSYLRA